MGFIFLLAYAAYTNISLIKDRVDDTFQGMSDDFIESDNDNYKAVNVSAYILLANYYVTRKSIENHPWTGHGLGTHEMSYDKYLPAEHREYSTLNRKDAGSMAMRLLTETGIIGLLLFCFFTIKYKLRSMKSFSPRENLLWIINSSAFVLIILYLFRNGNYTINGKLLFLLLYYYTFTFVVNERKNRDLRNIHT